MIKTMTRAVYNTTCDFAYGPGDPSYLTRYLTNIPCRFVPLLTQLPGIPPMSERLAYITFDAYPNEPTVVNAGYSWLIDLSFADLISVPTAGALEYGVLWVEEITWRGQTTYYRAMVSTPGAGSPFAVNASHGRQVFDNATSFTVPAGVTVGWCEVSGYGGGSFATGSAQGAGGAAFAAGQITLVPAAVLTASGLNGGASSYLSTYAGIVEAEAGIQAGSAGFPRGGRAANSFGTILFDGGDGGDEGGGAGSGTGGGGGGGGCGSGLGAGTNGQNGGVVLGGIGGTGISNGGDGAGVGGPAGVNGGFPGGGGGGPSTTDTCGLGGYGRIILTW